MEKIVHTKDVRYTIKFTWKEDSPGWIDYQVVQIESYTGEADDPQDVLWYNESDDTFDKAYITDPICNGFIKWDGCMEIHDMNVHLCYNGNQMQILVDTIYEQAKIIMGDRFDQ